jgi:hypothetical protein
MPTLARRRLDVHVSTELAKILTRVTVDVPFAVE